jgi:hypothetical protein
MGMKTATTNDQYKQIAINDIWKNIGL